MVSNIWRAGDNFDDTRDCCTYDSKTWEILSSGSAITEEHQRKCIPEGVEIPQVILDWERDWVDYQEANNEIE